MRTIALTALIASAGFGFAGESPKQAIIPASIIPQSSDCADCLSHSGLFLGAGVDYVFETETAYYNARVGYEFAVVKITASPYSWRWDGRKMEVQMPSELFQSR